MFKATTILTTVKKSTVAKLKQTFSSDKVKKKSKQLAIKAETQKIIIAEDVQTKTENECVPETLHNLLDDITMEQFTSSFIKTLACSKSNKIIFKEDAYIAQELGILSMYLEASEKGVLGSALDEQNLKFKYINPDNFKKIFDMLLIKIHEAEKMKKFLIEKISNFSEQDFTSDAFNLFARIMIEKEKQPKNSLVVSELQCLAEITKQAEQGLFHPNDLDKLTVVNKDECAAKILTLLNKKNESVKAERKEYGYQTLSLMVGHKKFLFFQKNAEKTGQNIVTPAFKYMAHLPRH